MSTSETREVDVDGRKVSVVIDHDDTDAARVVVSAPSLSVVELEALLDALGLGTLPAAPDEAAYLGAPLTTSPTTGTTTPAARRGRKEA